MRVTSSTLALALALLAGCSEAPETSPPAPRIASLPAEVRSAALQRGKAVVAETFSKTATTTTSAGAEDKL